jgi:hypothetical protein
MSDVRPRPTLDRLATYQIVVPGELDESWSEWDGRMEIAVDRQAEGVSVTIITATLDQAALHGLLRWLYALGLPLISVVCTECSGQVES